MQLLALIMSRRDDSALMNDDGADGNFVFFCRSLGLDQGVPHKIFVRIVHGFV